MKLKATPAIKEPGIIHKKEIFIDRSSLEKLMSTAISPLKSVAINVGVAFARGINIAIKNGTKSGATSRLIVLYVNSSRLPFTFPITRLKITITTPMIMEMIFANFT